MAENRLKYMNRSVGDSTNRAFDIRRDQDTFTTPVINIYDIDYAILYHLKNNLAFTIEENNQQIPVQVMFANGETWSQIQKHGYLRDKSRKVMTPVIAIRRTSIANDERFVKLDVPGINKTTANMYYGKRQLSNQNDWVHKTNRRSYEYFITTLPEYIRVSYDLYIWTELTTHLNYIVEELIPEHRMPWGDTMTFVTKISDIQFETINTIEEDRIVNAQMTLDVDGMIMPEYSSKLSTVRKAYTTKKVNFINEIEQYEIYPDHPPVFPPSTDEDRIDLITGKPDSSC